MRSIRISLQNMILRSLNLHNKGVTLIFSFKSFLVLSALLLLLSSFGLRGTTLQSAGSVKLPGEAILQEMLEKTPEKAIQQIERLRLGPIDGDMRKKIENDWVKIMSDGLTFSSFELGEIAFVGESLSRETWILRKEGYSLRVQFVFYKYKDAPSKLMLFRYDIDFWDLPWRRAAD